MLISDDLMKIDLEYGVSLPLEHDAVSDNTHQISPGGRNFFWVRCARLDHWLLSSSSCVLMPCLTDCQSCIWEIKSFALILYRLMEHYGSVVGTTAILWKSSVPIIVDIVLGDNW